MRRKPPHLKQRLDDVAARYDRAFLDSDPVGLVHPFASDADREVVAFLAAVVAYGSVKQIRASATRILGALSPLDPSPRSAILQFDPRRHSHLLAGMRHRFNTPDDFVCLLSFLRQMLEKCGSIEGFFRNVSNPAASTGERLSSFCKHALGLDCSSALPGSAGRLPDRAGVRFFFTDPADGSACKRLCMFLRWVARPRDGVDLGLWTAISPSKLIMPLDTHTTRICYLNGLSPSEHATWRNAEHVTKELLKFDSNDPVRYDFALSRLGILRVPRGESPVRVKPRAAAGASPKKRATTIL